MNKSLDLLNQIIFMAQEQDKDIKTMNLQLNKASKTVGESSLLFHLKALKELIEEESCNKKVPSEVSLDGKTFTTCFGQINSELCQ